MSEYNVRGFYFSFIASSAPPLMNASKKFVDRNKARSLSCQAHDYMSVQACVKYCLKI